ncbi:phage holin family protein [Dissulfurirhabdus thermomarina]|uniref:Phage holin family protein n=1 Tax=Dissulfurirhabdus thermomarina TaxID=1765737 RepID=A0A6N9TN69_DISTH|nr:phage holin family protein [Dissulfurirhabdus thermomarina]NDY42695.1 phage holin family protein [Dissulfurirhabdus thermomarina]NMX24298.1 phage holin family protein [Dissulfurirhabdus thermomarina]
MKGLAVRWIFLTLAILAAAYLLDGIEVAGFFSALFAAGVLGVLNVFFRPILILLTLPINILTLGLFTFVINAVLLMMASGVIRGFHVRGFWWAVLGSLVISLVNWLLNSLVSDEGRFDGTIDLRRRDDGGWE